MKRISTVFFFSFLLSVSAIAQNGKPAAKVFTILHTNDLHSSFIGMGPSSDYSPFELNNDSTIGGYARLGGLIHQKKELHKKQGAVLVLDAGDFSMGTPFGAATRIIGGELQLMSRMGYDATTFGNHEFDLGPKGLGDEIHVAAKSGFTIPIIASNTNLSSKDPTLAQLQTMAKQGHILPYKIIERNGILFGILGLLGHEATFYTAGAGTVKFDDAIETAKKMLTILRSDLKADVIICITHGGVEVGDDGKYSKGDDIQLAKEVPGIDIVISGHSHTAMPEEAIVNNYTVVVQAGKESNYLGELMMRYEDGKTSFESWKLNPVNDAMIDHDKNVGTVLEMIKKLGIEDNTIIMYSTDNGPHQNSAPDAGTTPFRSEKNTNWEGAYRVPAMVSWPGHIKPGTVSNEMISHFDWMPTLMAAAGVPDIAEKLLNGYTAGKTTYKVHLDGFSMLPLLTGQTTKNPRESFLYFNDDTQLTALRYDNWKFVFMEQRVEGTMKIWAEPFVTLRIPKIFNLRTDPYERADITSNTYYDENILNHAFLLVPAQIYVGKFIGTFKDFPPSQSAAAFNLDEVMKKMSENIGSK